MTTPTTSPREYLAVVIINAMGSSYHRAADPATAALKAAKQARRDWQRLYSIPKGHVWTVPTFDVTDHPNVYWDATGVYDEATNERLERHSTEKVTA